MASDLPLCGGAMPVTWPDYILGHKPLGRRPNVRTELARLRREPLAELLALIDRDGTGIVSSDFSQYRKAYYFYYLSLDRYLRAMSIAARFTVRGLKHVRRYSPSERRLAERYRLVAPFLEYDLSNCLLHSRILLDRVVAISRYFLRHKVVPSFTSFHDHKKFFVKMKERYGAYEEYARYIREETNWFDMPLKAVRDRFVVHSSPRHMGFLGYPGESQYELFMNIMLPDSQDTKKPFSSVKVITVSPLRLSYDIEKFLVWFCKYGVSTCSCVGRACG